MIKIKKQIVVDGDLLYNIYNSKFKLKGGDDMNYKKALGLGVLLWLIMFAVVSAFLGWYNQFAWFKSVLSVFAGLVAVVLAGYVKPISIKEALLCGLCLIAPGLVLDALITTRFNPAIFSDWNLWLSYLLVFLAPLIRIKKSAAA